MYYKQSEKQLHFNKQEHVIPAALGGIQKLENGVVSDEANERFSKIELNAIRNSPININRMRFGPGKRGSLNLKKLKNPIMKVLSKNGDDKIEFPLGFIFLGKSYVIPQVFLDFNDENNSFIPLYICSKFEGKSEFDINSDFKKRLIQFLKNKKRIYKLINMPFETKRHFIGIGYYRGKWYASTSHKFINMDILAQYLLPTLIKQVQENSETIGTPRSETIIDSAFKYKDQFTLDTKGFYFLYLKTAFNTLAFFKGTDFVCDEIFDEIRNSILSLSDIDKFIESDKIFIESNIRNKINKFPHLSHYVILCARKNNLTAYVSFYGEQPCIIKITDEYHGDNFIHGLICDHKKRKEFLLEDFNT